MKYEIVDVAGKGKGVVARQDIKKGELILKEKVLIPSITGNIVTVGLVGRIIAKLTDSQRTAILQLNDPNPSGPDELKYIRIIDNNSHAWGLFMEASRLNHNCKPNAILSSEDDVEIEVRALSEIKTGEEICVSYLRASALYTFDERKNSLKKWNFVCSCSLCSLDAEQHKQNDELRVKVREIMAKVSAFLDECCSIAMRGYRGFKKYQAKLLFIEANEAVRILSEDLENEAEPAILTLLGDLASLSELCSVPQVRLELPNDKKSGHYMKLYQEKASQMGPLFIHNFYRHQTEVMCIKVSAM